MATSISAELPSKLQDMKISEDTIDLRSQLKGVVDSRYNGQVIHFRGVPYATVAQRFASPKVTNKFPGQQTDFTKFGPRCPQASFDTRNFMQIPKTIAADAQPEEDELRCTNLNVTCPAQALGTKLPVLVWIYGGAMNLSYGNAEQRLGDAGPLVAQSVELKKPIVLVTIHYRVNVFGFGVGDGEVNLSHQDQKAALQWVQANIHKFGGDPANVTIAGESAGSIYTHALLASGVKVQRAILQSGSLYASPPQPDKAGFGLTGLIDGNLQLMEFDRGNESGSFGPEATLAGASVKDILQSLQDLSIARYWLWDESYLKNWDDDKRVFGKLKGLMVGDTAHEWTLYSGATARLTAKKLRKCFELKLNPPELGDKLAKAYGFDQSEEDHDSARQEALHFLGDARFAAWSLHMAKNVNAAGGAAYQYLYDEPTPFQNKSQGKAIHGVDLFGLFGGYDNEEGFSEEHRRVGRMMRTKWIDFVNGEEPWAKNETYVFGPDGMTGAIDRDSPAAVHDLNPRRRQAQLAVIREVGWKAVMEVWQNLFAAVSAQ